jgi:hypothetical protein
MNKGSPARVGPITFSVAAEIFLRTPDAALPQNREEEVVHGARKT